MNVTRRKSPMGIDAVIDGIQTRLNTSLDFPSDYNIYDRAYRTEGRSGVKLERFIGGNDYQDVFKNDKTSGHIVFMLSEESTVSKASITGTLSVFCFADLSKVFPNVAHRADAELHNKLYAVLKYYHPAKIVHGFSALQGYNVKWQDMQPWHVCRFDLKINYSLVNNC
ncbi:MAG: hypothetical protein WCT23_09615 [Candidatus Neomarinimicrobiota bacterium]